MNLELLSDNGVKYLSENKLDSILTGLEDSRNIHSKVKGLGELVSVLDSSNYYEPQLQCDDVQSRLSGVYDSIKRSRACSSTKADAYLAMNRVNFRDNLVENEYVASLDDIFSSRSQYKTKFNLANEIVKKAREQVSVLYSEGKNEDAEELRSSVIRKVYDFTESNRYLMKHFDNLEVRDMFFGLEREARKGAASPDLHNLVQSSLSSSLNKRKSFNNRLAGILRAKDIFETSNANSSYSSFYSRLDSHDISQAERELFSETKQIENEVNEFVATQLLANIPSENKYSQLKNSFYEKMAKFGESSSENIRSVFGGADRFANDLLICMNLRRHVLDPDFRKRDYAFRSVQAVVSGLTTMVKPSTYSGMIKYHKENKRHRPIRFSKNLEFFFTGLGKDLKNLFTVKKRPSLRELRMMREER